MNVDMCALRMEEVCHRVDHTPHLSNGKEPTKRNCLRVVKVGFLLHSNGWYVLQRTAWKRDVYMVDIFRHCGNYDKPDDRTNAYDCRGVGNLEAVYHMEKAAARSFGRTDRLTHRN